MTSSNILCSVSSSDAEEDTSLHDQPIILSEKHDGDTELRQLRKWAREIMYSPAADAPDLIIASELPTVFIQASANNAAAGLTSALTYLTLYGDLCAAQTDAEFEIVQSRVQREWQFSIVTVRRVFLNSAE